MKARIKRYLIEVVKVMLLVAFVILANVLTGWVLIMNHYSFYLAVFFFLFIPVWLVSFGLVFQPTWTWYSICSGSFLTTFFLSILFIVPAADLQFRTLNAFFLSGISVCCVLSGWLVRWMIQSILQEILNKKKKQDIGKHPTSFGL